VSTNSGGTWTGVTGANSDTYSFVASVSQSGDAFRAVFTNVAGSTTSDAATLAVTSQVVSGDGTIIAGNSKANCIYLNAVNGVLTAAELSQVEAATGVTYNCIEQFADGEPQWSDWENPWLTATVSDGWDSWLAASPDHQLVLGLNLVPNSVSPSGNPTNTAWEAVCASGVYDQYAVTLAQNLVAEGAGNSVIRLGKEFNGDWENDFIGNPTDSNYSTEIANWDACYQNEVTAMRSVSGEHFLFDWNPNTCVTSFPLAQVYPGNAYVDIIGADFYDADCLSGESAAAEGWNALYTLDGNSQVSLSAIVAFAKEEGKPLSIPEWGEVSGDDSTYMSGVISVVQNNDVAYQSYFDCDCDSILPLGSRIPLSTALYNKAFS
jgi:hypothetical protein